MEKDTIVARTRYCYLIYTNKYMWLDCNVRNRSLGKYRNESKQTVCIIGVLILSAKLCKADGHFSIEEEEEILKIIPHDPSKENINENFGGRSKDS